jgi:protein-disulfide isomerase
MRKAILTTAAIGLVAFGAALGATQGDAIKNWLTTSAELYKNRPAVTTPAATPAQETAPDIAAAPQNDATRVDTLADNSPPAADETATDTQTPVPSQTTVETVQAATTPVELDSMTASAGTETASASSAAPAAETAPVDPAVAEMVTQTGTPDNSPVTDYKVDVAAALVDREVGSPNAPVVIEDFSSLACPHCGRFHNEIFPTIKEKYIDTGKVRWIYRSYSLNEVALRAEMLARCAPGDQYIKLADMLFKNQVRWAFSDDPISNLSIIVRIAGITDDIFLACVNNKELQAGLLKKYQDYGNKYAIKATPTFVFNNGIKNFSGVGSVDGYIYDIEEVLRGAMETKQTEITPDKLDKALEKVAP